MGLTPSQSSSPFPDPTQSATLIDQTRTCKFYRNSRGEQFQKYKILKNSQDFQQKCNYRIRNASPYLVDAYFARSYQQSFNCTFQPYFQIVTQRIPLRLHDLSALSDTSCFRILISSLKGFHQIYKSQGILLVKDSMIGLNKDNKVKVWMNSNYGINQKQEVPLSYSVLEESEKEGTIVDNIVELVNSRAKRGRIWAGFVEEKYGRGRMGFQEAIQMADRWVQGLTNQNNNINNNNNANDANQLPPVPLQQQPMTTNYDQQPSAMSTLKNKIIKGNSQSSSNTNSTIINSNNSNMNNRLSRPYEYNPVIAPVTHTPYRNNNNINFSNGNNTNNTNNNIYKPFHQPVPISNNNNNSIQYRPPSLNNNNSISISMNKNIGMNISNNISTNTNGNRNIIQPPQSHVRTLSQGKPIVTFGSNFSKPINNTSNTFNSINNINNSSSVRRSQSLDRNIVPMFVSPNINANRPPSQLIPNYNTTNTTNTTNNNSINNRPLFSQLQAVKLVSTFAQPNTNTNTNNNINSSNSSSNNGGSVNGIVKKVSLYESVQVSHNNNNVHQQNNTQPHVQQQQPHVQQQQPHVQQQQPHAQQEQTIKQSQIDKVQPVVQQVVQTVTQPTVQPVQIKLNLVQSIDSQPNAHTQQPEHQQQQHEQQHPHQSVQVEQQSIIILPTTNNTTKYQQNRQQIKQNRQQQARQQHVELNYTPVIQQTPPPRMDSSKTVNDSFDGSSRISYRHLTQLIRSVRHKN